MKKIVWGIVIGIILAGAGYYFISPFFDTTIVDDKLPTTINVTNVTGAVESTRETGSIDHLSDTQKGDMMMQIIEANKKDNVPMIEEMPKKQAQVSRTYPIKDTPLHPASGEVRIVETGDETIVRFENFKTINGPNVHVYLAKDTSGKEFIDLGAIRGTEGNINYVVPEGVDLAEYPVVMHWCVPFSVLFNYTEIK
jgi:hypothetical protein